MQKITDETHRKFNKGMRAYLDRTAHEREIEEGNYKQYLEEGREALLTTKESEGNYE